ncbi:hypothetical protein BGZ60DRAFT_547726 [Tricladium varicosporioides]|nr:hypothetical protein BGZ60DRAFT_547726 [Hymenoscyphus varicosporioides]
MATHAVHENAGPRSAPFPEARWKRPKLSERELCVGCIVWLPERGTQQVGIKCNNSFCCGESELGDKGYNHPAVVLSIKQKHGSTIVGDLTCSVACVTSFTDIKLPDYLRQRQYRIHLQQSLPIYDPEGADITSLGLPCPTQLHLERGQKLRKQSYVGLQHSYDVPLDVLRSYSKFPAYKHRLEEESYKVLMRELKMTPETYPETSKLCETVDARLTALASSMGRLNYEFVNPRPATVIPQNAPRYTPASVSYTAPVSYTPPPPHYGATPQTANVSYPSSHLETANRHTATYQPPRPPIRYNSTTLYTPRCSNTNCCSCASNSEPGESDAGLSTMCVIAFIGIGFWVWWKFK